MDWDSGGKIGGSEVGRMDHDDDEFILDLTPTYGRPMRATIWLYTGQKPCEVPKTLPSPCPSAGDLLLLRGVNLIHPAKTRVFAPSCTIAVLPPHTGSKTLFALAVT